MTDRAPGSFVELPVEEPFPALPEHPAPFLNHRTDGQRGVITVLEETPAAREDVYELLADLDQHRDWAGHRHPEWLQRVAWIGGPERLEVGSRFESRQDTRLGHWIDRSIVVEASAPGRFGFDTEGIHIREDGQRTAAGAWSHRYRILARPAGGTVVELITRYVLFEGSVTRQAAPFIALNVQQGVQNLIQLAQERAGLAPPARDSDRSAASA